MAPDGSAVEKMNSEVEFTRVFDAPRELVFEVWTDARHLAEWWGPHGYTNPVCEVDVRPGGAIQIVMREPDGTVYPMRGVYQEVARPERLVFTCCVLDEEGQALFELLMTLTFAEQGGKTTLKLHAKVVRATAKAAPLIAGMHVGWAQMLERLSEYVAMAWAKHGD